MRTADFPEPIVPDNGTSALWTAIGTATPLSREREVELSVRIRQGDLTARNELIHANLRFVVEVALGYEQRGLTLAERLSAGISGLIAAAERFDGRLGYKFITYAVWWVRQSIEQALAELHARCGCRKAAGAWPTAPTAPRPVWRRSGAANHTFPSSRSRSGRRLKMQVIRLYYGMDDDGPITLEEIGRRMGLTRERVRQLKEWALEKLRHPSRLAPLREVRAKLDGLQ